MYPFTFVEKFLLKWRQNTVMKISHEYCCLPWSNSILLIPPIKAFMSTLEWINMCFLLLFFREEIKPSDIILEIEAVLFVTRDIWNNFIVESSFAWHWLRPKNFCSCVNSAIRTRKDFLGLDVEVLLFELLFLVNFSEMLQIKKVHEHLILNLDHAWEESAVEALVILLFTVDKLPDLEGGLTIIICLNELLVSNEETHDGVEE